MTSPLTLDQIQDTISGIIRAWEIQNVEMKTRLETVKDELLKLVNTPDQDEYSRITIEGIDAFIGNSGAALSLDGLRNALSGPLTNLSIFLGLPIGTSIDVIMRSLRDYYIDDGTIFVLSRGMTFGSPSYSLSVGDGELVLLTKDDNNQNIESCWSEDYTVEINQDQTTPNNQGVNNEGYVIYGQDAVIQNNYVMAQYENSNNSSQFKVISPSDSLALENNSFDEYIPNEYPFVGPLTDLPGWTVSSYTPLSIDTTNIHITNDGVSKPASLKISGDVVLTQYFKDTNSTFDFFSAFLFGFYYNRSIGSATGDLKLTFGQYTITITLASETGWVRFPISSANLFKLWSKNFTKTNNPKFEIETSGLGGFLLIDNCISKEFNFFNGLPHLLMAGETPFQNKDKITFSVSNSVRAINQTWLSLVTGIHLPHTTGIPTWAEPDLLP